MKTASSLLQRDRVARYAVHLIAVVELQWMADTGLTKIAELAIPQGAM